MTNNILYKKDDIVCLLQRYKTPIGEDFNFIKNIAPLKVVSVYPDNLYEDREGENGCANEYRLVNCITGVETTRYQYELTFWSEMKTKVIQYFEDHIKKLEAF